MLILFAFMLTTISLFTFFSIYNNKHRKATLAVSFFIGLTIMIIANMMYQIHLGSLSSLWISNNRYLYDLILKINFSFSSIQLISLFGECLILFSIFVITNSALIKKNHLYIVFAIALLLYFALNTPEILYSLYLAMNSNNQHTVLIAKNLYIAFYIFKLLFVSFVFLFPFGVCIYKFFTRTFSIIKRNVLLFSTAIISLEAILFVLIRAKYIHSFFALNLTIFYSDSSTVLVAENVILTTLVTFSAIFVYLIVNSKLFSSNYFDGGFFSVYDSSKKLDKTLRMVLHTYKNMFLAINQLSKMTLSSETIQQDQKNNSLVNSIQDISKDALYNITHLLHMLSNVEIVPQRIDLRTVIDTAVSKNIVHNKNLKLTINCPQNVFFVGSDDIYMTDLVYNIYKNSCEAVESLDNPSISITVNNEDEWNLIEIKDNGCGIPKDIKKQIFKPLVSNKQGSNNWGIGLYYAKKIVKSHNGHIFVESKQNKYTKFEIYLPVHTEQE